MRPWTYKSVGVGVVGLLLISLGTCVYLVHPWIFDGILRQAMSLTPSSKAYELWKDTSGLPPMYLKIYFFNWTNPDELRTSKPVLQQLGPYAFREVREKLNIVFHPENHTVSYFQRRYWYFEQDESNGSLEDEITQLNIVAISAAHKIRYWDTMLQSSLSLLLKTSQIYVKKTVNQLLFSGYDDPLISLGKIAITDDEELPPFDRFGWFYMRNGSTDFDGRFNMDTGAHDMKDFGVLRKWDNEARTKYHKSPCNIVEGSAGEFWPPHQQKDDIMLFSADLCRPLIYEYMEETEYLGIKGHKYALGDKTLGNETKRRYPHEQIKYLERTTTTEDFFDAEHSAEAADPSGEEDPDVVNVGHCFCNGKCSPAGLMNITSCRYGAPAFVSLPHFHKADPSLRQQVVGMHPTDEHDFYITLEPNTGVPLDVSANLQVNILLQPSEFVLLFENIPTLYFPVFWFSLKAEATEELAHDLWLLLALRTACIYAGIITAVLGGLVIFVGALLRFLRKRQRAKAMANNKNIRTEMLPTTAGDKSELIYMDRENSNEDPHVKSDRRLYPNPLERCTMDLRPLQRTLQNSGGKKSNACE